MRTVQRTVADPVVAAEIERLESEGAVDEPAVATLRAALLAEKRAGVPDWTARIAAARVLLSNSSEAAPEPRSGAAPPRPHGRAYFRSIGLGIEDAAVAVALLCAFDRGSDLARKSPGPGAGRGAGE